VVRKKDRDLCLRCLRRWKQERAKQMCPRCRRPGLIREVTGWCGLCSKPAPPKKPLRVCVICGELRRHCAFGMCSRCWQRHPHRPFIRVNSLIDSLENPPVWLGEFAAELAGPHCPARASQLIGQLGRLLRDGGLAHPQALIERTREQGRSMGTLARALQDFFVARRMAIPTDHADQLAAGRRQRRIDTVPEPLRPAVIGFVEFMLNARHRARQAGTLPRTDHTIETHLSIVRDLARVLHQRAIDDWATVDVHDVEAFLQTKARSRQRRHTALRHFFRWARSKKIILINPMKHLTAARSSRAFSGKSLDLATQKQLFHRWTTSTIPHPHEALVGLLALLHGASSAELRLLTIDDIDHGHHAVQLGRRPRPTPLDPSSWAALQRCLDHRQSLRTQNRHVVVTRGTKARQTPASAAYFAHVLDPAGVTPRTPRSSRLLDLTAHLDPKLVAATFAMKPEGVLPYLADRVDPTRIPNP
jgi:site-specific recombinase XerD